MMSPAQIAAAISQTRIAELAVLYMITLDAVMIAGGATSRKVAHRHCTMVPSIMFSQARRLSALHSVSTRWCSAHQTRAVRVTPVVHQIIVLRFCALL